MKISVIIPTFNKAYALRRVLEALRSQKVSCDYEIVVTDDGSSDDTKAVCEFYSCDYAYLDRPTPCGPAAAKNNAYRRASGDVFLCQNDDILHTREDAVELLCDVSPRSYSIPSAIIGLGPDGAVLPEHPGQDAYAEQWPSPICAAIRKRDIYGIGGEDEDFTMLNCEDVWTTMRLVRGRGLKWRRIPDVPVEHIWHERPAEFWAGARFQESRDLLEQKVLGAKKTGNWTSPEGPWSMTA